MSQSAPIELVSGYFAESKSGYTPVLGFNPGSESHHQTIQAKHKVIGRTQKMQLKILVGVLIVLFWILPRKLENSPASVRTNSSLC